MFIFCIVSSIYIGWMFSHTSQILSESFDKDAHLTLEEWENKYKLSEKELEELDNIFEIEKDFEIIN